MNYKNIKEKYEMYEKGLRNIEEELQAMCEHLSGITDCLIENLDYSIFNPFGINYEEKITGVCFGDTNVIIDLEYKDIYEGYDSRSNLVIPIDIVNKWFSNELDYIKDNVLKLCKSSKQSSEDREINSLKLQAGHLGYELVKKGEQ
tara:strand:- start:75 stop:512 length:438 start_codon:yes stop_codon:yes gene_type:complete